jgi:hypothetical protein
MEHLLQEQKRLNTEIHRGITSNKFDKQGMIYFFEHTRPLIRLLMKVEHEIASKRRMLTLLVKDMLKEVEVLFRADQMMAASDLLLIARNLARLIYEEDDFKRDELVSELTSHQQHRAPGSEAQDFLAGLLGALE